MPSSDYTATDYTSGDFTPIAVVTPDDPDSSGYSAWLVTGGLLGPPYALLLGGFTTGESDDDTSDDIHQDLLDAIWAYADSSADLNTAFHREGWLWIGKGARGVPLPYAVVFETGTDPVGLTTGVNYHENVGIQFNVFAASEAQAKRLGELVNDTFSNRPGQTAMVFEGGVDLARWQGVRNILERDPAKGAGAVDVFVQRINFVWRVGRTLQPV